ncbi:hypothetical protein [Micromonospora sp. NPDC049301]|uniref:hypothetical protein n=1 Tax=Micromonospora sp. NPDC049301 TaxID=3155723 RepID=UPI00341D89C3
MHMEATLRADPERPGHEDMDVVGEGGGVFDTVQVGGRRAGDQHAGWQSEESGPTGEGVVPLQPRVGVDVMAQSHPRGAAQLMFGDQAVPDRV